MYLVLILFVISFLTFGAWRITQQRNSLQQVAQLEFTALVRHELVSAGAVYALDFYKDYVHGMGHAQHATEVICDEYVFVCTYNEIGPGGAQLVITVYEKQKNIGTYQYHIMVKAGKFWCARA